MICPWYRLHKKKTMLHKAVLYTCVFIYMNIRFFQNVFSRSMQLYLSTDSSIFMTELCNAFFHKLTP